MPSTLWSHPAMYKTIIYYASITTGTEKRFFIMLWYNYRVDILSMTLVGHILLPD